VIRGSLDPHDHHVTNERRLGSVASVIRGSLDPHDLFDGSLNVFISALLQ